MQLGNAVDVRASHGCQVSHTHAAVGVDAHTLDGLWACAVLGLVVCCPVADLLDDLEVARKQFAHQLGIPHLECFWKQGVAGVVEGALSDGECGIPVVTILIDQQAHELSNGNHRVSVVELEGDLVWEGGHIRVFFTWVEQGDGVSQGCCREEVLLLQAKLLANVGGIFWVENLGDGFCPSLALDCVLILGTVEGEQVEFVDCLGAPQTQGADAARFIAWNHVVVRNGAELPCWLPFALAVLGGDDNAAQANALFAAIVCLFPWATLVQPVVWTLNLVAVLIELLAEDAVGVANAVADCRNGLGCQGVDEAGSKTAEATVAQAWLNFHIFNSVEVEAELLHSCFYLLRNTGIEDGVWQLGAEQVLSREVTNSLGVALQGVLAGFNPLVSEKIAHHGRNRYIHILVIGLGEAHTAGMTQCSNDLVLELLTSDFVAHNMLFL